jgi:hypothetical protein
MGVPRTVRIKNPRPSQGEWIPAFSDSNLTRSSFLHLAYIGGGFNWRGVFRQGLRRNSIFNAGPKDQKMANSHFASSAQKFRTLLKKKIIIRRLEVPRPVW